MSFGDWISLITLAIVVYQASKDLMPNAKISISTHERDDHLVACVSVMARDKVLRLKSLRVKGYKVAPQKPDRFGNTYGPNQLHCVSAPEPEFFSDSLPINCTIESGKESRDWIFVVAPKPTRSWKICFVSNFKVFRIEKTVQASNKIASD